MKRKKCKVYVLVKTDWMYGLGMRSSSTLYRKSCRNLFQIKLLVDSFLKSPKALLGAVIIINGKVICRYLIMLLFKKRSKLISQN